MNLNLKAYVISNYNAFKLYLIKNYETQRNILNNLVPNRIKYIKIIICDTFCHTGEWILYNRN